MCVKFPPGDLNPSPYPSHLTSTYTYKVTIALKVCGGIPLYFENEQISQFYYFVEFDGIFLLFLKLGH